MFKTKFSNENNIRAKVSLKLVIFDKKKYSNG